MGPGRMIRVAAFTVGLVLAAPAAAVGQTLSINNEAGVPQSLVSQMERAAVFEVNGPVHLFYSSARTISWDANDPASWQVNLVPAASWSCPPTIPTGCPRALVRPIQPITPPNPRRTCGGTTTAPAPVSTRSRMKLSRWLRTPTGRPRRFATPWRGRERSWTA
jgi:hypothetical protein